MPAVRSVRIALETLDLLELDLPDVRILMNRAGADVGLDTDDIEQILRHEIAYTVPSDRAVPLSINRGRPVTSDDPGSPAARLARRGQPLARGRRSAAAPSSRESGRRGAARGRAAVPISQWCPNGSAMRPKPPAVLRRPPGATSVAPARDGARDGRIRVGDL